MEKDMDKGKKKEAMDPIMMEEDQIKQIMEKDGKTGNGVPYQYKMNSKKIAIDDREGLTSDEKEVEDLWAVEQIEEILHVTYERKVGGPRSGTKGRTQIQITVSVEPTTPCATDTLERKPTFRKSYFSGIKTTRNTSNKGASTGGAISGSNNEISTPRGGSSSTQLKMVGHDPTIRLPEFRGEASKDPEKQLFICENIWEAKQITGEDKKLRS
jgi:hypothetical protein